MKAYITIVDENEQILVEEEFDACQPKQFRVVGGQKYSGSMPPQSDNKATGTYDWFGFTYQPHVAVQRPNGYTAPPPTPWAGIPIASPFNGRPPQYPGVTAAPTLQQGPGLASSPNPTPRGTL